MKKNIIFWMLFKKSLQSFIVILCSVTFLLLLVDLLQIMSKYKVEIDLNTIFSMALYKIPSTINTSILFIFSLASIMTFWNIKKHNEYIPMLNIGLDVFQILKPIGAFIIFISTIYIFIFIPFTTYTTNKFIGIDKYIKNKHQLNISKDVDWYKSTIEDDKKIFIKFKNNENWNTYNNVEFYIFSKNWEFKNYYIADKLITTSKKWEFINTYKFDNINRKEKVGNIEFNTPNSYSIKKQIKSYNVNILNYLKTRTEYKKIGISTSDIDYNFTYTLFIPIIFLSIYIVSYYFAFHSLARVRTIKALTNSITINFCLLFILNIYRTYAPNMEISSFIVGIIPSILFLSFALSKLYSLNEKIN